MSFLVTCVAVYNVQVSDAGFRPTEASSINSALGKSMETLILFHNFTLGEKWRLVQYSKTFSLATRHESSQLMLDSDSRIIVSSPTHCFFDRPNVRSDYIHKQQDKHVTRTAFSKSSQAEHSQSLLLMSFPTPDTLSGM